MPWEGEHFITTEFGKLTLKPREILVMPRGVKFSVELTKPIRGYICEVFKGHFKLPDLGPIGANGLANPRDFEIPVAFYENNETDHIVIIYISNNYRLLISIWVNFTLVLKKDLLMMLLDGMEIIILINIIWIFSMLWEQLPLIILIPVYLQSLHVKQMNQGKL